MAPTHQSTHFLRDALVEELHSRPFLRLYAPCRLAFIALKPETDGVHNAELAHAQLIDFLDRFNAPYPDLGAIFYFVNLGEITLKWENHSEFATYTLFTAQETDSPFADDLHSHFASDWIAAHPGRKIASISMEIEAIDDDETLESRFRSQLPDLFKRRSFAAAYVTDKGAAISGDFDLDPNGHTRFAVLVNDLLGPGRIGRVAQRLLEIETYRAMSMLTLPVARKILGELHDIETRLSRTVEAMGSKTNEASKSLEDLLKISSELTILSSQSSFRFSAARAYEALVAERLENLREERILGRQLFSEFMLRRYSPTMRTCVSASRQLDELSERAAKAAELLGTRVSVTTASQNRQLLAQMDNRAAQQARLQETVEGISVVAISYYAVSLLTYLLAPLTKVLPISKTWLAAALVIPVAAAVWIGMHRLKERLIRKPQNGQENGPETSQEDEGQNK